MEGSVLLCGPPVGPGKGPEGIDLVICWVEEVDRVQVSTRYRRK